MNLERADHRPELLYLLTKTLLIRHYLEVQNLFSFSLLLPVYGLKVF